jgi:hypothetical protein
MGLKLSGECWDSSLSRVPQKALVWQKFDMLISSTELDVYQSQIDFPRPRCGEKRGERKRFDRHVIEMSTGA